MIKSVAIACDHGGYEFKKEVIKHLEEKGISYKDFGCDSNASVDYPDYGVPAAKAVAAGEFDAGILICGTGIGMSLCANKVKGIRASVCTDTFVARMTRAHNDSNVLCMGARVIGPGLALDIVDAYLNTEFDGGRHAVRIGKVMDLEK